MNWCRKRDAIGNGMIHSFLFAIVVPEPSNIPRAGDSSCICSLSRTIGNGTLPTYQQPMPQRRSCRFINFKRNMRTPSLITIPTTTTTTLYNSYIILQTEIFVFSLSFVRVCLYWLLKQNENNLEKKTQKKTQLTPQLKQTNSARSLPRL